METRMKALVVAGFLLLSLTPSRAKAGTRNQWNNLRLIRHDNVYKFALRGGKCLSGQIATVADDAVGIRITELPLAKSKRAKVPVVRIKREDLIRVKDGMNFIDIVYSERSSWSDLLNLRDIDPGEYLLVVKKGLKQVKGKLASGTQADLTLRRWGNSHVIAKSDVSLVYYVRTRPASDSVIYSEQEMFLIDPRLWPYMLGVAPKMSVLLYDASRPEDDTPIQCSNAPVASQ